MPGCPNKTNGERSKRAGRKPWGEDEEHPVAGPKRKIDEERPSKSGSKGTKDGGRR